MYIHVYMWWVGGWVGGGGWRWGVILMVMMMMCMCIYDKWMPSFVFVLIFYKFECLICHLCGSNLVVWQTHNVHYNDKDEVLLISELRVPLFSYSYGTVFGNSVAQIRSFNKDLLVIVMETLWLILCLLILNNYWIIQFTFSQLIN